MAQRSCKSPVSKPKARYRVKNWREYDRALVARGSITLWIDEAVLAGWRAAGGKGWRYSDAAILCALSLRAVFGLTLRQTQGFLCDLTRLMGLAIAVPHYSTFSRRAAVLPVPKLARPAGGPLHLAVDATGLKVYGEGEWKVRVHGKDKRRGLAQAAPGRRYPDRRTRRPCPDRERGPRRCRARRPARRRRRADRRGLRRQGLRQLRLPCRHPRARRAAGDPAAQGRRDPPAAGTGRRRAHPRRGCRPHRRGRARTPGRPKPATTAAPSPKPRRCATRR